MLFLETSYNRIKQRNLSYNLTLTIIDEYNRMFNDLFRRLQPLPPMGGPVNPFANQFANPFNPEVQYRQLLNQMHNNLNNKLQQQNFSNTTILEPFWNDTQIRRESVQNTIAINSNILPIGINTSNNMSMYASVVY